MKIEQPVTELIITLWIFCISMSFMLNFNFIGAIIIKDWNWIMKNWFYDINVFTLPLFYIIIHYFLITNYKKVILKLKKL